MHRLLTMPVKRTLDTFFQTTSSSPKKARSDAVTSAAAPSDLPPSTHPTYPFAVPQLPTSLLSQFDYLPSADARRINNQPDLDLLYYQPFLPNDLATAYFHHLRRELFFYRVTYPIKRGPVETIIRTPRYTTVFGLDATAAFPDDPTTAPLLDATTRKPLPGTAYKCSPRPLPACLDALRIATEATTGLTWNFCLVNYYARGADSISYHSDDERFLGHEPAIASFSFGATRDFCMKHKPVVPPAGNIKAESTSADAGETKEKPLKLPLGSGDMVLMQGPTQANWLHSIPKRAGKDADKGRINITFRRALVKGGTENYYRYNVGDGGVFKWNEEVEAMVPWDDTAKAHDALPES